MFCHLQLQGDKKEVLKEILEFIKDTTAPEDDVDIDVR